VTDASPRTSEVVREVIEEDPVIRLGLEKRLFNARALARYIQTARRTGPSRRSSEQFAEIP